MSRFSKPIRLSRLQAFPGVTDLAQLLAEAEKRTNQTYEIAWPMPEGSGLDKYVLSCAVIEQQLGLVSRNRGDRPDKMPPSWTMRSEQEGTVKILWSHSTSDLSLVLTMLSAAGERMTAFESSFDEGEELVAEAASDRPQASTGSFSPFQPIQTPPNAAPVPQMPDSGQITLAGDVQNMELPSLFQSISICKMTGRLNFYREATQAEVYFEQGTLTHATIENTLSGDDGGLKCEQVVLELLTWTCGTFRFNPGWTTAHKTINRRLDGILLEGATLVDYLRWLEGKGLSLDCQLKRERLPDATTEGRLRQGAPVEIQLQKDLYSRVKTKASFADAVGKLPSTQWIPALYNLVNVGLLGIVGASALGEGVESVTISQELIHNAARSLTRPDSGIVTYPLMLHFLSLEFARARIQKMPLCLVLFELQSESEIEKEDLETISSAFAEVAEPYEMLAHNENFDSRQYAIVLPGRTVQSARAIIEKMQTRLNEKSSRVKLFFGLAGAPQDARDMESLVTAATQARKVALSGEGDICLFSALQKQHATTSGGI